MKKLMTLLTFLFFSPPMYADEWDDSYNRELDVIQKALAVSGQEGYVTAAGYAISCRNYIIGFIDGNIANGNFNEYESKRYTDWAQERRTLLDKMRHFSDLKDYGNGSYYAKKDFELTCQYAYGLERENAK